MKKSITILALFALCFSVSAQDFVFPTAMGYDNGGTSYVEATRTITWSTTTFTGARGYKYAAGSYLDASAYTTLVVKLASVSGSASCRIYYSDGTNETTNFTTSAISKFYNITLNATKKIAITQIEIRVFGTPPTVVVIENMYLSNTLATGLIDVVSSDPIQNEIYDIQGHHINVNNRLERGRIYISNGKKFVIQ
jgi:hypothetical protein